MTTLTSGSAGAQNLDDALDKYKRLFSKKLGDAAGMAIIKSTAGMDPVKRLWELEHIYVSPTPKA